MRLEKVRLSGFRSLRDLTLELGDLTVITGPNNAGKSNLLAGLAFLGDVYARGLDAAMQTAGGYDRIAYRRGGEAVGSVGFDVDVTDPATDSARPTSTSSAMQKSPGDVRIRHLFNIDAEATETVSSYALGSNHLRISGTADSFPLATALHVDSSGVVTDFAELPTAREEAENAVSEILAEIFVKNWPTNLATLFRPEDADNKFYAISEPARNLASRMRGVVAGIRILRPVPHLCRQPAAPGPNVLLSQYGENLPAVADHLRRAAPATWLSVQEVMTTVVPGLLKIDIVPTEDRKLALRFEERGVGRPWTAGEVSDGTVQALALVLALFDDRIPLLGIEEPENALHPWILREILKVCTRQAGKQVVMTTHSPVLVDYVPAESVHLMWREGGQSKIGKMLELDTDVRKVWEGGGTNLFELYDSGGIPQATPGDAENQ
ncbi:AAA family ATPase [Pseudofrankia inefficax]|uniref:ATPase AAA-type core domain-containing protein n=1 Tax=Pseudofrankia inefficax (strain DSM 45817 / CECT 9037 / DDB 130130 / EuI1c) TaxID=298654 RepID=E3J5S0_PSEI1|nr:ATP-binding protein [Pseudofrankia inefficax]ADP83157.1 hypothetical protein FraEuI1c_5168 [Pseudofrankia inefficax]